MKKYIGVDLGGTNIKLGVVGEDGTLISKLSVPTGSRSGASAVINEIGNAVLKLLDSKNLSASDITALGMGVPGYIDSENGEVIYSNNLKWKNVKIVQELKEFLDVPMFVNNDANVAAIGEAVFGAGKNYQTSVFITLGTGVGSGVIINKKVYEGYKSTGTELGHIKIGDMGHKCTCGRLDCWETYSSATALIRDTKHKMLDEPDSEMWAYCKNDINKVDGKTSFECAKKGDTAAKAVVDNYIKYLGDALVNISNIFGPEAILIGGGVCAQGDYLILPLKAHFLKHKYGGALSPEPIVERASLANDAGTLGGAALAISKVN